MNKNILLILLLIFFSFLLLIISEKIPKEKTLEQNTKITSIKIGKQNISVEIADTNTLRSKGLSNRESLPENTGMLFVFDTPKDYGFWMKDMKIPLDIVFIDENLTIKSIKKAIYPNTFPEIFMANTPIMYVLEINAGFSSFHDINEGDTVILVR